MLDQSCGSVLVTEMVWIRPRVRVDLCSKIGIEMGIEREQQIRKKWVKRERARAYVKRLVERNLKKIEKIDYLNKRGDRIDELI